MRWRSAHGRFESRAAAFTVTSFVAVAVGGLALLVPPFFLQGTIEPVDGVRPYSALELEGRDIYIREGCNTCHSQQIRPFKAETDRYGPYSLAGEFVYDRPFLWGSRRTGPDLARVGGKYPDAWHWLHLVNPRELVPQSNMPDFAFLTRWPLDTSQTPRKLRVLRALGHPYGGGEIAGASAHARAQAEKIAASLRGDGIELTESEARSEAIAVIAYLQSLGTARAREPVASLDALGSVGAP